LARIDNIVPYLCNCIVRNTDFTKVCASDSQCRPVIFPNALLHPRCCAVPYSVPFLKSFPLSSVVEWLVSAQLCSVLPFSVSLPVVCSLADLLQFYLSCLLSLVALVALVGLVAFVAHMALLALVFCLLFLSCPLFVICLFYRSMIHYTAGGTFLVVLSIRYVTLRTAVL
jgi:hypothetical protein